MNRVARYTQVGLAVRDAAKMRMAETSYERQCAQAHLYERLDRLRGLPQKMTQILSMSRQEVEESPVKQKRRPQALGVEAFLEILRRGWQESPKKLLDHIDSDGCPASLGQVHRAILKDGREVAIKAKYPQIREAIYADLKLLGWMFKPFGGLKRGFDLSDYQATILDNMNMELNYEKEALNQEAFAAAMQSMNEVVVPQVHRDLSNADVMVMDWEQGSDIDEVAASWSEEYRQQVANMLVKTFCVSLFEHGLFHADPNPGNYRFRLEANEPRLVLYDYGCMYRMKRLHTLCLVRLIRGMIAENDDNPYQLFLALGFKEDYLEPIADKLPALCNVILESFKSSIALKPNATSRSQRIRDILGDLKWNFRIAAPAHLIFLVRAITGLEFYIKKLDVGVCWRKHFEVHAADLFSQAEGISVPKSNKKDATFSSMARNFNIQIIEKGAIKLRLSLPVSSVDNLEEIMGPSILKKAILSSVDIKSVSRRARSNGYRPMNLFCADYEAKQVKGWLE